MGAALSVTVMDLLKQPGPRARVGEGSALGAQLEAFFQEKLTCSWKQFDRDSSRVESGSARFQILLFRLQEKIQCLALGLLNLGSY